MVQQLNGIFSFLAVKMWVAFAVALQKLLIFFAAKHNGIHLAAIPHDTNFNDLLTKDAVSIE